MNAARIKLSARAASCLRRIASEEEAYMKLTARDHAAAKELQGKGFAILIPVSWGGFEVALTSRGIEEATQRKASGK